MSSKAPKFELVDLVKVKVLPRYRACHELHSIRKLSVVTWSKSFHRGGVTGVRMLNSKASGWVGTFTMVSRVPSIVWPEGEKSCSSFWRARRLVVCASHGNNGKSLSNLDSQCSVYAPLPQLFFVTMMKRHEEDWLITHSMRCITCASVK